jgi:hypothetical protein
MLDEDLADGFAGGSEARGHAVDLCLDGAVVGFEGAHRVGGRIGWRSDRGWTSTSSAGIGMPETVRLTKVNRCLPSAP